MSLAAQHLTYVEMEMLGLLPANSNFVSFCVVRNPYDRALSSVMHFSGGNWKGSEVEDVRRTGFERHLEAWLNQPLDDHNLRAHRRNQVDYVRNRRGEIAIEHILRFETLAEDFSHFSQELGLSRVSIGKVGDSGRRLGYRDYYTDRAKGLVEDCLGDDLEAFGYDY